MCELFQDDPGNASRPSRRTKRGSSLPRSNRKRDPGRRNLATMPGISATAAVAIPLRENNRHAARAFALRRLYDRLVARKAPVATVDRLAHVLATWLARQAQQPYR
jgi:hypothetical protein